LVVVDVATGRTRLATGLATGVVLGSSWSPDSRALLVAVRPFPYACSSLERIDVRTGVARVIRRC
jgi:hypothetical protein